MSIIQKIRDKAAWLVFGLIALSLLGFLLMDAFVGRGGRGGMFSGTKTTVGVVSGHKLEAVDYETKVKQLKEQYQAYGYPADEQNIKEQVWNQFISESMLDEETDKLGLSVEPKELDDLLFGKDAPQDFKRQFTNEQGIYDVNAAKNAIAQLRKQKSSMADNFNNIYLPALMKNRLQEKFTSLLTNTTNYPKWMLEKLNSDNSSMAAVSYVNVPYSTVSDSTVKVTDEDISDYVGKHPKDFKQEETRSIAYVAFDASPSATDSAALRTQLEGLKNEFASTKEDDINNFLIRNGAQFNFNDAYVLKSKMQMPNADSIRNLADGAVYGPYLDGGSYTIAKMLGKKTIPDTVKVRHILIKTMEAQQNGQPQMVREDSVAKKLIDSIAAAIKNGADFNQLVLKYSDDQGSKDKKGEYTFGSTAQLVKPFYDVAFYEPVGTKKVVKAESGNYSGYHYIEVLEQKNFEPAYKVAYLAKPIGASQETEDKASGLANQFAAESRTAKAFDENAKKRNYNRLLGTDIKPADATIPGLGNNRQLVMWLYKGDKGDVSEVYNIGSKYVVAMITDINEEGTMSPAKARPLVEYILRNRKKAEQIKKKLGTPATLEAAASAGGQQVLKADSLSFATPFFPNAGMESRVGGYAFNAGSKGKVSPPIEGMSGVYVIRTENVYAKANEAANIEQQKQMMIGNQKQAAGYRLMEALKKAAKVKDNRRDFY